jgi:cation:H+ antiporter
MGIILILILLALSIMFIWKGSDWVTDSLIPVANKLGTGYIAITTLMVSFLISIPELFTSVYTYFLGHLNVGLGVIIGSVMINVGLTVGLSATIKPLNVDKSVVIRDGIFLIIMTIVVLFFGSDLHYERSEGIVLMLLFIPYALNVWSFEKWRSKKSRKKEVSRMKKNLDLIGDISFLKFRPSLKTFLLGAAILTVGSYLFSVSLIGLSNIVPLPELLIGILFGAIGTGTPNIVAALQGTVKGYDDAAITETFGSNIFTLLITFGIVIVLQPFTIGAKLFYFDLVWMIMIHLLMLSFIFKGYKYREKSITRFEGVLLLLFYIGIVAANVAFF